MNDTLPLANLLQIERIRQALQTSAVGHTIHSYTQLPSTMITAHDWVRQSPCPAHSAGIVIVAEEQSAGRGRLQRRWDAPPGRALLTSTVVAHPLLPIEPAQLSMIAGLALLDAVRNAAPALARHLWLKWPNDLLIVGNGAAAKLAGILIESALGAHGLDYAILGIGINVNQRAEELPAQRINGLAPASLYTLLGHEIPREDLLIGLCRSLNHWLDPSARPSPEEIHRCWQNALISLGYAVTVRSAHTADAWVIEGRAVMTTLTGSLIVEQADGTRQIVEAGDAEFHWNHG